MSPDSYPFDIANSLSQIGEATTTEALARRQDITGSVRVMSKKNLTQWIESLITQAISAHEDAFTDEEKDQLLKQTQEELARRAAREQEAVSKQNQVQAELDRALEELRSSQGAGQDFEQVLSSLNDSLKDTERRSKDLQDQNFELQDEIREKLALLSATIAEKEKLRAAIHTQVVHSSALMQQVLGLDQAFYGGRHAQQEDLDDDATDEQRLFHDFEIGNGIIASLQQDLQNLRTSIDARSGDGTRSLEQDVAVVRRLHVEGERVSAFAAPVADLVEALDDLRTQSLEWQSTISQATGGVIGRQATLPFLPDPHGEPVETLAATLRLCRDLGEQMARDRLRLEALVQMSAEADSLRNDMEQEVEVLRRQLADRDEQILRLRDELATEADCSRTVLEEVRQHLSRTEAELSATRTQATQAQDLQAVRIADLTAGVAQAQAQAEGSLREAALLRRLHQEVEADLVRAQAQAAEGRSALGAALQESASWRQRQEATAVHAQEQAEQAAMALRHMTEARDRALETVRRQEAALAELQEERLRQDQALAKVTQAQQALTSQVQIQAAEMLSSSQRLAAFEQDLVRVFHEAAAHDAGLIALPTTSAIAPETDEMRQLPVEPVTIAAHISRLGARHTELTAQLTEAREIAESQHHDLQRWQQTLSAAVEPVVASRPELVVSTTWSEPERVAAVVKQLDQQHRDSQAQMTALAQAVAQTVSQSIAVDSTLTVAAEAPVAVQLSHLGQRHQALVHEMVTARETAESQHHDLQRWQQTLSAAVEPVVASRPELVVSTTWSEPERVAAVVKQLDQQHRDSQAQMTALAQAVAQTVSQSIAVDSTLTVAAEAPVAVQLSHLGQRHQALVHEVHEAREETEGLRQQVEAWISNLATLEPTIPLENLTEPSAVVSVLRQRESQHRAALAESVATVERLAAERNAVEEARNRLDEDLRQSRRDTEVLQETLGGVQADLDAIHGGDDALPLVNEEVENLRTRSLALQADLNQVRDALAQSEAKALTHEMTLRRQWEELTSRLSERDRQLADKDAMLDRQRDHQVELASLTSRIEVMGEQLAAAQARIQEFEALRSTTAEIATRTTGQGLELRRLQAERDQLREERRELETALASAQARADAGEAHFQQQREEILRVREEAAASVAAEQAGRQRLAQELLTLRQDVVGLRGKLRKPAKG